MEELKQVVRRFWGEHTMSDLLLCLTILLSISVIKLAPIVLVVLLLWSLYKRKSVGELKMELFSPLSILNYLFILFFVYHLVGMFWSENTAFGWMDVGMKMSFFVVPLIAIIGRFTITRSQLIYFFSWCLTFLTLVLFLYATYNSITKKHTGFSYFYESEFSAFMHRSYWATYTALAATWMLFSLFSKGKKQFKKYYFLAWLVLSVSTILTISKAGIIIWILLNSIVVLHVVIIRKWKFFGLSALAGMIALVCFLFFSNSRIAQRFQYIPYSISHIKTEGNNETESNAARLIMWSTSIKIIKQNWLLGVGTGDVKDELISTNLRLKNLGVAEKKLNSHNQFLNTWVQLGIIGFTLLLSIFIVAFSIAIKQKSFQLILFGLTFFITMLFESFIETQAGIVPFCLLFVFLCQQSQRLESIPR